MKKVTLNWYVLVAVALGIVVLTLGTPKVVNTLQEKQQAVQDSITELNQIIQAEHNRYVGTIIALDSISRKGGTLPFVNSENKNFEVTLVAK